MTTISTPSYDLVEIEARARQMRADMITTMLRTAFAWARKPRATTGRTLGQTA